MFNVTCAVWDGARWAVVLESFGKGRAGEFSDSVSAAGDASPAWVLLSAWRCDGSVLASRDLMFADAAQRGGVSV